MNAWLMGLGVFALTALIDVVWARYNIACAEHRPLSAASWSMAISAGGSLTFLAYVDNHAMLVPSIAGAFVGTYVGVRRGKVQDP